MYKHILIAIDGSPLSKKAVKEGIGLAKTCGAAVTAFYATPEYETLVFGEYVPPDLLPREEYEARAKQHGEKVLTVATKAAEAAGVKCATSMAPSPMPWEAIVEAARKKRCDLIVMASHGRRGLAGVLLGSETSKVLTHSKIPVLVCR